MERKPFLDLLSKFTFPENTLEINIYTLNMFKNWIASLSADKYLPKPQILSGLFRLRLRKGNYRVIQFLFNEKEESILEANSFHANGFDDKLENLFSDEDLLFFTSPLANAILDNPEKDENSKSLFVISLISQIDYPLTVDILGNSIVPYLGAISEIQKEINSIVGVNQPEEVDSIYHINAPEMQIHEISQHSPISVTLSGVAETLSLILSVIIPWRRNNAKSLAQLAERQATLDVEVKQVEVLERRLQYRQDIKKIEIEDWEIAGHKLALEKQKVEVAQLRLDFEKQRIQLAMSLLKHVKPEMTEDEKLNYAFRLLQPLQVLLESDFEMQVVDKNSTLNN